MTRSVIGLAAVCTFVGGVGIAAAQPPPVGATPPQTIQEQQPRPPKRNGPELTTPRNSRGVTATGCLKQERDVVTRPDLRAGGGGEGTGYVLTGAKLSGPGVASGGEEGTAELYLVLGLDAAKLREHANQQVEVKGRLNLGLITPPDQADTQPPTDPSQPKVADKAKGLPAVTADSIKTLSASCVAGSN